MSFLLAFLVLAQQDQTALRTEKGDYLPAAEKCEKAEAQIESNPRAACDLLDEVLANAAKLRKIECRLRIEERPAEYTKWTLFLPYQYRGRARLNLARKSERDVAEKLLAGAIEDLQTSFGKGIASSEEHLKAAKAELEKLKAAAAAPAVKPPDPVAEDPLPKFRAGFRRLLTENRYKTAAAFVASDGKFLTDAQKKTFGDEAAAECRTWVDDQVLAFRRRLARDLRTLEDLQSLTDREVDLLFAVAAPDERVVADPVGDWVRSILPAVRDVQKKKSGAESLFGAAAAAVPLAAQGENPYFLAFEGIAVQAVREGMGDAVARSKDAAKAARDAERARADGLHAKWKDFAGKLDPAFRDRHPVVAAHGTELDRLLLGFPVDLAELDKVDLEGGFADPSPLAAFARLEQELRSHESKANLTRESRQRLYSAIVAVSAIRALAEGKGEAQVSADLAAYREKLRAAGGAVDADRFGARVSKVFEALR
jgi:hypothetical protein